MTCLRQDFTLSPFGAVFSKGYEGRARGGPRCSHSKSSQDQVQSQEDEKVSDVIPSKCHYITSPD